MDYHFISLAEMREKLSKDEFLESVEFGGNFYGTSKKAIEEIQGKGKVCVLDVDIRGIEKLRSTNFNPIYIFIQPPNLQVLKSRLQGRKSETEESLNLRISRVQEELDYGAVPGNFHKVIVNENLPISYKEFKEFVINELKAQISNGIDIKI